MSNWNQINQQMIKQRIYEDYLFWHTKAKQSQAIGDCQSAYSQRMMAIGDWMASGNKPDQGHYIAAELMLKCANKKSKK